MGSMKPWPSLLPVGVFLMMCLVAAGGQVPHAAQDLPYTTEEVSYSNPDAPGVELAGVFTKPRNNSAVPAVLLISGAGPQDRDETTGDQKPFAVLADYLAQHNIAVLRVDDRGVGQSKGTFESAVTNDFASDAQAGVRYLMTRPDVDQKHIGLIGHGEGAIVATIVASKTPQIAFVVLLSGTAVSGDKVLLAQTARAQRVAGLPDEQIEADLRLGAGLYRMAAAGRSQADMRAALDNLPEEYKPFADPWRRQLPKLQSPWLRSFLAYDPSSALEQLKCPVLALWGEKDTTLDPEQNSSAMKKAFSKAHNREAKIKILPGLNYLFQKANTGLASEYQTLHERMSPIALENIQTWIAKQVE